MSHYQVSPNLFGRLFTRLQSLTVADNRIEINVRFKAPMHFQVDELEGFCELKKGILGAHIQLATAEKLTLEFLSAKALMPLYQYLQSSIAKSFAIALKQAQTTLKRVAFEEFLRDSSLPLLKRDVYQLVEQYRRQSTQWHNHLSTDSIAFIRRLDNMGSFTEMVMSLREHYEHQALRMHQTFFDQVESHPLTDEQRLAVVRHNDRNLVLAAAGTGKTSVIIAKAMHLILQGMAAEQILILAYNKAAVKELCERFKTKSENAAQQPHITTFHGLANQLVKKAGHQLQLSELAHNEALQKAWLANYVRQYWHQCEFLIALQVIHYEPKSDCSQQTFVSITKKQYHHFNEVLIANILTLFAIPYQQTYLNHGSHEICVFELSSFKTVLAVCDTKAPLVNKMALAKSAALIYFSKHKEVTTALTNLVNDILDKGLVPSQTQIQDTVLMQKGLTQLHVLLNTLRGEQDTAQSLVTKMTACGVSYHDVVVKTLDMVASAYKQHLQQHQQFDFDDMIRLARDDLAQKRVSSPWQAVLVDEFQDISTARMGLLKQLMVQGERVSLSAVGDDWQAIYRFSGGRLDYTTEFGEMVGSHSLSKLQKTFRYNNAIAEVAGNFVMKNPAQYRKNIITHDQVNESKVMLLATQPNHKQPYLEQVQAAIRAIRIHDKTGSIAILGRYQKSLNELKNGITETVFYWTLHASKGLEADHCIIVGLESGYLGFPSERPQSLFLNAILPSKEDFPDAEERRLMYVAITRAKHSAYLIYDPLKPSAFVSELGDLVNTKRL